MCLLFRKKTVFVALKKTDSFLNLIPLFRSVKMLNQNGQPYLKPNYLTFFRLSLLEKLEEKLDQVEGVVKKEADEENDVDMPDEDEEMDDGTDYANNYFDNGEGYEDDDDNLEDGPIYQFDKM